MVVFEFCSFFSSSVSFLLLPSSLPLVSASTLFTSHASSVDFVCQCAGSVYYTPMSVTRCPRSFSRNLSAYSGTRLQLSLPNHLPHAGRRLSECFNISRVLPCTSPSPFDRHGRSRGCNHRSYPHRHIKIGSFTSRIRSRMFCNALPLQLYVFEFMHMSIHALELVPIAMFNY